MRIASVLVALLLAAGLYCSSPLAAAENKEDLSGFVDIFDGKTLDGWQKLTSYNDHGQWEVIDGAIAGDQWPEGEGGLLVTKKQYSNFEIYAEVKTTYPQDSGLFLRVQPNVLSYQITIDHRPEGEIGAVYIPMGGGFAQHCYEGFSFWDPFDYNAMRVRIENQPPRIQVHPGENWRKGSKVLFRKIAVKELE